MQLCDAPEEIPAERALGRSTSPPSDTSGSPPGRAVSIVAASAVIEAEVSADKAGLLVLVPSSSPLDTTAFEEDQLVVATCSGPGVDA